MVKTCYTRLGQPFQVDDDDYEFASVFRWQLVGQQNGKGGGVHLSGGLSLARLLMLGELVKRLHTDPRIEVDHIDGDIFNNTRSNLRFVSRSENGHYKWKRMALDRIRNGVKCSLKCPNRATSLVRLPAKRYLYLCDEHFVTNKQRGQDILGKD